MRQNDEMLSELSGVVGDLKKMALEMSATVDNHNDTITQIEGNVNRANVRLKKDTARIQKQL